MEKKNNPFAEHLTNKEKANDLLIEKAINLINKTGGNLSQANISKITKEIDPKKKGISPSGISRNKKHKDKILLAQLEKNNNIQKLSKKDLEELEISEIHAKLFLCRMELEQVKQMNKALEEEIKYVKVKKKTKIYLEPQPEIVPPNFDADARIAINKVLNYILEDVAVKNEQGDIIDTLTGKIILDASIVRKFSD